MAAHRRYGCSLYLVVWLHSVSGLSDVSKTSRVQQYGLTPWHRRDVLVGEAAVEYKGSVLEVVATTTIVKGEATTPLSIQVPIPDQEGSLASSLWPASCAFAMWWARYGPALMEPSDSENMPEEMTTTRILELGSGLGVTGWMAAAALASSSSSSPISLVLTDQDQEAVARLAASASKNPHLASVVETQSRLLDWRDDHSVIPANQNDELFDVLVGSDIVYYHFLVGPLADTIQHYSPRKLLVLVAPGSRESMWTLCNLLEKGGYNARTDKYEKPWPGALRLLLYRLENQTEKSTTPLVVLCWTMDDAIVRRLDHWIEIGDMHVVTKEDEASIEKTF